MNEETFQFEVIKISGNHKRQKVAVIVQHEKSHGNQDFSIKKMLQIARSLLL